MKKLVVVYLADQADHFHLVTPGIVVNSSSQFFDRQDTLELIATFSLRTVSTVIKLYNLYYLSTWENAMLNYGVDSLTVISLRCWTLSVICC